MAVTYVQSVREEEEEHRSVGWAVLPGWATERNGPGGNGPKKKKIDAEKNREESRPGLVDGLSRLVGPVSPL
jgi:hypothetical protein